ncbi:MAG: hypothetical protein HYV33_02610 [Candidatus Kerfeldbacteria bacterium]|nr:hypothetical protein [Candidatus Kerfeldbacteria bacterium]
MSEPTFEPRLAVEQQEFFPGNPDAIFLREVRPEIRQGFAHKVQEILCSPGGTWKALYDQSNATRKDVISPQVWQREKIQAMVADLNGLKDFELPADATQVERAYVLISQVFAAERANTYIHPVTQRPTVSFWQTITSLQVIDNHLQAFADADWMDNTARRDIIEMRVQSLPDALRDAQTLFFPEGGIGWLGQSEKDKTLETIDGILLDVTKQIVLAKWQKYDGQNDDFEIFWNQCCAELRTIREELLARPVDGEVRRTQTYEQYFDAYHMGHTENIAEALRAKASQWLVDVTAEANRLANVINSESTTWQQALQQISVDTAASVTTDAALLENCRQAAMLHQQVLSDLLPPLP